MPNLDVRPEGLDVTFRPGGTITLNLNGPAGWLDTRAFTATLNGTSLNVSENGDTLIIVVSAAVTAGLSSQGAVYDFLLHQTGGNDRLVGKWRSSLNASPAISSSTAVLIDDLDVAVSFLGAGEGGGGGTVDSIVAGTGIEVDSTDPANPVVSATGGGGGQVESVVAGHGVDVDSTDPTAPVVAVDESELDIALVGGTLLDGQVPATIARDSEVTAAVAAEAALARNADNLTSGTVADARIPASIARDSEVTSAIATHAAATDPHGDRAYADGIVATETAARSAADALLTPQSRTVTAGTGLTGGGDLTANRSLAADFGTGAGKVTQGNDPRLSDARTPTAHHATHENGGTDELALDASQVTSGVFPIARLATGTPDGSKFIRDDGTLATPAGGGSGIVDSIVAGDNITVDSTDDANPVVSVTGLGAVALSNDYGDLDNLPTLGTAAAADTGDFDPAGAADAKVIDSIADADTTHAPSRNAVFDALAGKQDHSTALDNVSGVNTGDQDLSGLVPKTTTVNGHALSGNVSVTASDVGLGNVTNDTQLKAADLDTDTTLAASSDTKIPSQHAVKVYIDTAVTGLLELKGSTDASGNPNYPAASKGDTYVVTVAGKIGGASGKPVDVGDMYVATADNAGGTEASVGTSWAVLEHNLVGALLAANNLSDLTDASAARTNLGLGTLATQNGTFSGSSSGTNTGDQDLSGLVPKTTTVNGHALSGNVSVTRGDLALDTSDSPQFAGVNVGHASDTTITRVSAGVIAVEGQTVYAGTAADARYAPLNVSIPSDQTGTTYTLVLTDANNSIGFSNASAITVTVPPNSSVAFPVGSLVELRAVGAGQITVAPGSGVTLRSPGGALKSRVQYSAISLLKIATDAWSVQGDLTT